VTGVSGATADESTRVTFTARPTAGDIIANAVTYVRRSGLVLALGAFTTVSSALGLVLAGDPISLIFLLLGLSFLSGWFVVPIVWWSIRLRRDLVLAPFEVEADDAGIAMTASYGSSRHAWSVYRRVRETDRAFTLDIGTGASSLITKRGVPDAELAAFRALLIRVGVLSERAGLRRFIRPILWVAVGSVAAVALLLGPRAITNIGATATMSISTEVEDGTVTVSGETDLPDGAVVSVQVVQWDKWQEESADGTAPDVGTSPWVVSDQVLVMGGRYETPLFIGDWPAGKGLAITYFWIDLGQPAEVIERFGLDGAGLKGADVSDKDLYGPTLEVQEEFDIP